MDTYLTFAEQAYLLMATCGLVLGLAEILDMAQATALHANHPPAAVAQARAQVEAKLAIWNRSYQSPSRLVAWTYQDQ